MPKDDADKARLCAANNADFYQAVFRAQGLRNTRNAAFWSSDAVAPPYYSNLTTLDPEASATQIGEIARLQATLGRQFSLKDGFGRLDVGGRGFRPLFSASWIYAEAHEIVAAIPTGWQRIQEPAALAEWERAWNDGGSPADSRVFVDAILRDPGIAIFGRVAVNGFDAGCIANRSERTVGVSNIFHLEGTPPVFAEAASLAASAFAPDLPVVGYDRGVALDAMLKLGFRQVGQLRVWLSNDI